MWHFGASLQFAISCFMALFAISNMVPAINVASMACAAAMVEIAGLLKISGKKGLIHMTQPKHRPKTLKNPKKKAKKSLGHVI